MSKKSLTLFAAVLLMLAWVAQAQPLPARTFVSNGQVALESNVYVSNTIIAAHHGIAPNGGAIISLGNNQLVDNKPNGAFTSTLPQQ